MELSSIVSIRFLLKNMTVNTISLLLYELNGTMHRQRVFYEVQISGWQSEMLIYLISVAFDTYLF